MKQFLLFAFLSVVNAFSGFAQYKMGDLVTVDGVQFKLKSENMITNPGFEDGLTGWTDATNSALPLNSLNFNLVETGGVNNSKFLIGKINDSSTGSGSIGTGWAIEPGKSYFFSYYVRYMDTSFPDGAHEWLKVSLTNNKNLVAEPRILMNYGSIKGGGEWTENRTVFTNSDPDYAFVMARFRWLNNGLGFDEFALHEVIEVANVYGLEQLISEAEDLYDASANLAEELQEAIEKAREYLGSELSEEVSQAISELETKIARYKYANASVDNPLDMTHYIVNPGFDENTSTGWKGIGVIDYHEVEFYQKTFNMYQQISGLPAGKYILKAQGFERPKSNDGGAAYRAGTETIYACFYAKASGFPEKTTPFPSIYEHRYTGSDAQNGYVNNMSGAEKMLTNATQTYYEAVLTDILLDEGDVLTIGAKTDFQQTGYWVLFDNFRLEYVGAFETGDLEVSLREFIVDATALLEEKMQTSVREELNAALGLAQELLEEETPEYEALYAASQSLSTAIQAAHLSHNTYLELEAVIEEATEIHAYWSGTKAENLLNAIHVAKEVVDDLTVNFEVLNSALGNLRSLIVKKIYVPWNMGNVNDPANNWSMERSKESKNWIIFWEPGYGDDPSVHRDGSYRIDIEGLLNLADHCFDFYTDSLKFIKRGSSKTDQYKMIIRLRYTRDWEASGSGVDDQIGLLTLTAWSAQAAGLTLAHEVGHCFQYQVHCDNGNQNGWMYGYGDNASGGNGWWEQCAQWQGYQIFPNQQFTDNNFNSYLNTVHKHILHEAPRYDNYFIQDYWCYLHGMDFIGRLWNESRRPEDPIETYRRITGITQSQFNDEMYDCAARFATWDVPALKARGASKINSRPQPSMVNAGEDHWLISPSVCLENYGHNIIKLNVPASETTVSVAFEGKVGMTGYRRLNVTSAGWRFGFVALQNDGTRVYSDMGSAAYRSPTDTLHFVCPANTKQLWLVVTGAPSTHWRHAWDDNDGNDEQWPYQVKFKNTNLQGRANPTAVQEVREEETLEITTVDQVLSIKQLNANCIIGIYDVTGRNLSNQRVSGTSYSTELPSGIYIVTIHSGTRKYTRKVVIK